MSTVRVLDCTVRDGGLMNRWAFDETFVRKYLLAIQNSGVDYVELGYRASTAVFSPADYGPWRFCPEELLGRVWNRAEGAPVLTLMVDVGRVDLDTIPDAKNSPVGAYRVAAYVNQGKEALALVETLATRGYETFLNVMAVSEAPPAALEALLKTAGTITPLRAISVVDSYGNLTPVQTKALVQQYREWSQKSVGFHGHNNLQLALANSLAAWEAGAEFLDASLGGMGRGAGNTPVELLLPQLGYALGNLEPLFELLERDIVALQRQLNWGYRVPYVVAGLTNQHPREALALVESGRGAIDSGYFRRAASQVAIPV